MSTTGQLVGWPVITELLSSWCAKSGSGVGALVRGVSDLRQAPEADRHFAGNGLTGDQSHQVLDRVNADQDRRIAAIIRSDPRKLRVARTNLGRWMAADGKRVRPAFLEWHAVLHRLTAREIAAFLCSETPLARRLRQSSPMAGILGEAERQEIRKGCEKAGA